MRNRYFKLFVFLFCDFICALLSLQLSFAITGVTPFTKELYAFAVAAIVWPAILLIVFYLFKIYNILWRYSGIGEFVRIIAGTGVSLVILFITQMAVFNKSYELTIYIIAFFLTNASIFIQRLFFKKIVTNRHLAKKSNDDIIGGGMGGNIMLIGAGSAGEMLISELVRNSKFNNCKVKCVIDDNPDKKGQYILGVKIIGGRDMIIKAAEKYDISTIVFAIPACKSADKKDILSRCQKTKCELKIVPSICAMYNPTELSDKIRKVEIEDLLGRDAIDINNGSEMRYIEGKVVLITGGGGTIGSELCRQIALYNPKQLIIFDIYENNAYEIQNELKYTHPNLNLVTLIGSVRDTQRLEQLFDRYRPDIVYHAAAHKHVPLMEDSPNETVKNNVFGTYKTAQCADKYGVQKFVLISTDKAVNPTNIMGASKRICEMIVQTYNKRSKTEFVAVRFGNVLGSNGSVIPLFKKQIEHGGPVTVTDPDIIRYFMTIPEAVSLVLLAGANAKGGEIFVLDMGQPVKILSLAENLIRLSGLIPYEDIKIKFTGLRPGEKLYEELLMSEEGLKATDNNLIHIGRPIDIDEDEFLKTLEEMRSVMYNESVDIREYVAKMVPTYKPQNLLK